MKIAKNILAATALVAAAVIQTSAAGVVSFGQDGQLEYGTYANQGQTNSVNTVPDFSRGGYKGGGEPIPFVSAEVAVTNGVGDDTALIQNAIDTVSALPVGGDGFRGAVLLTAGTYEVSSTLFITNSGVVLRGAGSQASGGTKVLFTATVQDNLIEVAGSGSPAEVWGTRVSITDSYVPVGAKSFAVSSAAGYSVGDTIRIQNKTNDKWITDLGMDAFGDYSWSASVYQLYHERVVTAVTGNTVTVDAPIMQVIEDQYGGGDIFKYTMADRIENVGIESLRLESIYLSDDDEAHGWVAVVLKGVENAWVRQVTAQYFGFGCVSVEDFAHQITIEDCAQLDPKSITTGGRKYSFYIDDSDYVLVQRCYARGGRHDFASGSLTPGPNAFVDCWAVDTYADIGPHHRYATGQIYDNVAGGQINVQNRALAGPGHGWAGAQVLFWNCDAASMICDAPLGAMNWSIGSMGTHLQGEWALEPDGIWESHGTNVAPRSLYYAQLSDRLGSNALCGVMLPEQSGNIWSDLSAWAGDGLMQDDLIVWNERSVTWPVNSVQLNGIVQNLQLLDSGAAVEWSKISGPGPVSFGDKTAPETAAIFGQPGDYVLRLIAGGSFTTVSIHIEEGGDDPNFILRAVIEESTNETVWSETEELAEWFIPASATNRFYRLRFAP